MKTWTLFVTVEVTVAFWLACVPAPATDQDTDDGGAAGTVSAGGANSGGGGGNAASAGGQGGQVVAGGDQGGGSGGTPRMGGSASGAGGTVNTPGNGGSGGVTSVKMGGSGGQSVMPQPGAGKLGWQTPPDSPPEAPAPACQREVDVTGDAALATALGAAKPGDCITLADGSYKALSIKAVGTADAPIVVRARNRLGATIASGQLVVQAAAHLILEGLRIRTPSTMKMIGSHHVRVTRCKLELTVQDDWLLIYGQGSAWNRIDHCELGPKPTPGPFIVFGQEDTMSKNDRVDHNYFHDNGPPAVNEKESVRIGWSGVSMQDGLAVVEHNLFENCDGDPEIVSVKTHKNVVRYNTVRSSTGVLSLRHGNGSFLYGNFILGNGKSLPCKDRQGADDTCGTGGIRVYGRDHVIWNNYIAGTTGTGHRAPMQIDGGDGTSLDAHHQVVNVQVVANTIVDNASGLEIGRNYSSEPRDVLVAYNLIQAPSGRVIQIFKPKSTVTFTGNITWPTAGNVVGVMLAPGEGRVVDPRLGASGGILRVMSGSPVVDAAAALAPFVKEDIEGRMRMTPDVGAEEAGGSPAPRRPLTAADVGPAAP